MSYLLRVSMPDRPGSLGALATAIGTAGGDIVGVDVVERRGDIVVDDFLIELPPGILLDALVTACRSLEGSKVEFVGRYGPGGTLHRDLEAVEAMTGEPERVDEILVDLVPGVFRPGWALLLANGTSTLKIVRATGGAPQTDGFEVPWLPLTAPGRVPTDGPWAPDAWQDVHAVAVPVHASTTVVVLGRDGGPRILDSELARLVHLAALADVIRRGAEVTAP